MFLGASLYYFFNATSFFFLKTTDENQIYYNY